MKRIDFKIISILFSIVLFTQCSEKDELNNIEEIATVSTEDIARIGEFHNECVINMLSDFDWKANDFKAELIDRFNALDYNQTGTKSMYTVDFIEENCNTNNNINNLKQELSPEAFSIIEEAISLCENVVSYTNFIAELVKLEQGELLLSLNESEKLVVLASISIWKNSAYLWLPKSMGGGEGYDLMMNRNSTLKSVAKWDIRSALVGDGISGGIGCLGVAVAGACGPIGWVALAIVAGESAVSSVISGF